MMSGFTENPDKPEPVVPQQHVPSRPNGSSAWPAKPSDCACDPVLGEPMKFCLIHEMTHTDPRIPHNVPTKEELEGVSKCENCGVTSEDKYPMKIARDKTVGTFKELWCPDCYAIRTARKTFISELGQSSDFFRIANQSDITYLHNDLDGAGNGTVYCSGTFLGGRIFTVGTKFAHGLLIKTHAQWQH